MYVISSLTLPFWSLAGLDTMRVEGTSVYKIPLFPLKGVVHHRRYVYVYIRTYIHIDIHMYVAYTRMTHDDIGTPPIHPHLAPFWDNFSMKARCIPLGGKYWLFTS